jgi:pimeloyl-ACP methyl ester carboxylesterase
MTLVPFKINVPQRKLNAIRAQLELAEIGYAPEDDIGWKYGTAARYLSEFRDYWLSRYDWRRSEAELNRFPQFMARVEDIDVHFYHVRGKGRNCFPIILTHGWPGSVFEFLEVIEPLTEAGYDLVIPSLPGYGFSSRPATPIGRHRVAYIWRKLMVDVLGYKRFGAQGGDWGSGVTRALAQDHADVVRAIHLNLIFYINVISDDPLLAAWRKTVAEVMARECAYLHEQQTKPQTIALALSTNPLAFAAWVLEKCNGWADTGGRIESRFTKDQLITNIMTYLVNDAVGSAIWLYYGATKEEPSPGRIDLPTGFAAYPVEIIPPPPRYVAELEFNITRWTKMPAGGHFAAWEEPAAFAGEVAAFFAENR